MLSVVPSSPNLDGWLGAVPEARPLRRPPYILGLAGGVPLEQPRPGLREMEEGQIVQGDQPTFPIFTSPSLVAPAS